MELFSIQLTPSAIAHFMPPDMGQSHGEHIENGLKGIGEAIKDAAREGIHVVGAVDPSTLATAVKVTDVAAKGVEVASQGMGLLSKAISYLPFGIGARLAGDVAKGAGVAYAGHKVGGALSDLSKSAVDVSENLKQVSENAKEIAEKGVTVRHGIDPATLKVGAAVIGSTVLVAGGTAYYINSKNRQAEKEKQDNERQIQTKDARVLGELRRGTCGNPEEIDEALIRNPQFLGELDGNYQRCFSSKSRI